MVSRLTELPACLNKSNLWITCEIWDGSHEEVRFRLEIGIKYSEEITLLDISMQHPLFQCTSLVSFSIVSDLIFYVLAFLSPNFAFQLHQILLKAHNKPTAKSVPLPNQRTQTNMYEYLFLPKGSTNFAFVYKLVQQVSSPSHPVSVMEKKATLFLKRVRRTKMSQLH